MAGSRCEQSRVGACRSRPGWQCTRSLFSSARVARCSALKLQDWTDFLLRFGSDIPTAVLRARDSLIDPRVAPRAPRRRQPLTLARGSPADRPLASVVPRLPRGRPGEACALLMHARALRLILWAAAGPPAAVQGAPGRLPGPLQNAGPRAGACSASPRFASPHLASPLRCTLSHPRARCDALVRQDRFVLEYLSNTEVRRWRRCASTGLMSSPASNTRGSGASCTSSTRTGYGRARRCAAHRPSLAIPSTAGLRGSLHSRPLPPYAHRRADGQPHAVSVTHARARTRSQTPSHLATDVVDGRRCLFPTSAVEEAPLPLAGYSAPRPLSPASRKRAPSMAATPGPGPAAAAGSTAYSTRVREICTSCGGS
jgi:hypothetical protein